MGLSKVFENLGSSCNSYNLKIENSGEDCIFRWEIWPEYMNWTELVFISIKIVHRHFKVPKTEMSRSGVPFLVFTLLC